MKWAAFALMFAAAPIAAHAAEADVYWLGGTSSTGFPIQIPTSAANPLPVTGSFSATTAATASASPTPVSAGTGKPLNIDLNSSLFVNCVVGCSGGPADESAFTPGTTGITTGGFFQTTATNNALTTGQAGSVQMTSTRAFFINLRNAAGTEIGTAAAPVQVSLANTGANTNKLLVTPDSVALPANQSVNVSQVAGTTASTGSGTVDAGTLRVTLPSNGTGVIGAAQSGTWNITNISGTVSLPTGAATAANQATEISSLATIATNTGAAIPAGSALIGKVGLDQTTPGTTNGVAVTAAPLGGATGGTILSAASNNSTSIKASAGTLYSFSFLQTTTTLMDVRFYDTASAPTCSSATGMKLNFVVQSNTITPGGTFNFGSTGVAFTTGIGICITGANANNDNTNAATGLNVIYAFN